MIMKCKVWVKWPSSNPILKNIPASMNTTVIPISQKSKQNSGPKDRKCNLTYDKHFCFVTMYEYEVITVNDIGISSFGVHWYTCTFHSFNRLTHLFIFSNDTITIIIYRFLKYKN